MSRVLISLAATSFLQLALTGPVAADAVAEKLVEEALPLMHHSCKSAVEATDGDVERIEEIVRALTAVSLYNHEIVISEYATSEDEKSVLRDRFIVAIKSGCEADAEALLAGVVDDAVVYALSLKK